MIIAVPTGIKIFSWLSESLSKTYLTKYKQIYNLIFSIYSLSIQKFYEKYINYIIINDKKFKYIITKSIPFNSVLDLQKVNSTCLSVEQGVDPINMQNTHITCFTERNTCIVLYGSNSSSTIGLKYTKIVKNMVKIPNSHIGIIIGILLSDAHLSKGTNINARMQFKQSLKNISYFYYVYNKLNHYCFKGAYLTWSTIQNKKHFGIAFTSRTLPCLTELFHLFYKFNSSLNKNIKIVPRNLYELITWESLAHWIMCDGTYNSGVRIQTESFTIEDVVFIINILKLKFNLDCSIHYQRNYPVIYIKSKSIKKNLHNLLPFMCGEMLYKLLPNNYKNFKR